MRLTAKDLLRLRRKEDLPPGGLWCKIIGVNIPARVFRVNAKGYHGPRKVQAVAAINFGTVLHPLVYVGDEVFVERDLTGHWWATQYKAILKCHATTPLPIPDQPLPQQAITPISDFNSFSPFILPDQPFPPSFLPMGQISPPADRGASLTYDVGGGYVGTIPLGSIAQAVGLVNGATWNKYFVTLTGTDSWTLALNGTTIASGSGSGSGAFSPAVSFAIGSYVVFTIVGTGTASNLFWGVGV